MRGFGDILLRCALIAVLLAVLFPVFISRAHYVLEDGFEIALSFIGVLEPVSEAERVPISQRPQKVWCLCCVPALVAFLWIGWSWRRRLLLAGAGTAAFLILHSGDLALGISGGMVGMMWERWPGFTEGLQSFSRHVTTRILPWSLPLAAILAILLSVNREGLSRTDAGGDGKR